MRSNSSSAPAGNPPTPAAAGGRGDLPMTAPISKHTSTPSLGRAPDLREDTHGVIPYAGEPKLALYSIERELTELLDMRTLAEEEGALPAELEAIDKTIAEYFAREVKKVDGISHAIRAFEYAAEAAAIEADRIKDRSKHLRSQAERLRASALRAMEDHGVRVLETPTNKLRVQANGGKEPLETSPDFVFLRGALEYTDITITLPSALWREIVNAYIEAGTMPEQEIVDAERMAEFSPNGDRIRAALKQQVPCPECKGIVDWGGSTACSRCEGRGTIPNTVPGAKLLPRGFHLRIK